MRFLLAFLLLLIAAPAQADEVMTGVAFDRGGELGAFATGLSDARTGRAATPDDPARIASISKLVVAIGVMKLVEQRALDLDQDVSRYLDWPLRNPAFLDRPITLRMLLSHTASLRDGEDLYVIPLGTTLRDQLANPTVWDPAHGPGEGYFTYGNMNFPVIAAIVEKVTRERFDTWMRREVLDPLKIDACYNWPTCSDTAVARAIVLTLDGETVRDDLGGKRPECPVYVKEGEACDLHRSKLGENGALWSPQGGLRISVRGLSRVGRMLLNHGELDGVRVLQPASVDTLLAPVWVFNGSNGKTDDGMYCSYGLATQQVATPVKGCKDDPAGDGAVRIGHAGDAYGLRSGLWIDQASDTGIAYLVTDVGDARPEVAEFTPEEIAAFKRTQALIGR
jgi:CubicO group peptidase (beta-lactamase class C family)